MQRKVEFRVQGRKSQVQFRPSEAGTTVLSVPAGDSRSSDERKMYVGVTHCMPRQPLVPFEKG